MLHPAVPTDARQTTLKFLVCLITGQVCQPFVSVTFFVVKSYENFAVMCKLEILSGPYINLFDIWLCFPTNGSLQAGI